MRPTGVTERVTRPPRPTKPSRPMSVFLSSPNHSDSDPDIPRYTSVSKAPLLAQSLSLVGNNNNNNNNNNKQ